MMNENSDSDEPLTHEEEHIIANYLYQQRRKADPFIRQMYIDLEDRD